MVIVTDAGPGITVPLGAGVDETIAVVTAPVATSRAAAVIAEITGVLTEAIFNRRAEGDETAETIGVETETPYRAEAAIVT